MRDIRNKIDLEKLVKTFYDRATKDDLIGHYFTSVIPIDWDRHIPIIISFWSNILFNSGEYKGGMMYKHMNLNYLSAFEEKHFDRWLALWNDTVDQLFVGPQANEVKYRAKTIAVIMQTKLGVFRGED
ncbi:group III truncated hemoglobin [Olivibacter sp. SDN3]|uniref:group III truncated hemoglobin n=1 Tax=Olivibacter sp. SDN3 TaxID=2764720 RepID=UPI0016516429|nr:group III truncated hemoglobin [Olivibacter sp. SDN3]QNL51204.1 group III truncated hemoglobin [Olivibacter sp. SDN3]